LGLSDDHEPSLLNLGTRVSTQYTFSDASTSVSDEPHRVGDGEVPGGSPLSEAAVRIVLTTVAAGLPADVLAQSLVEERLAACVNILPPMTSVYRWRGRIERDAEQQLVIKTTSDRLAVLRVRLAALHPYELPELIVLPVMDGSPAYLDWVRSETTPAES
jgi:periplasmic divalent cation tolerance protein